MLTTTPTNGGRQARVHCIHCGTHSIGYSIGYSVGYSIGYSVGYSFGYSALVTVHWLQCTSYSALVSCTGLYCGTHSIGYTAHHTLHWFHSQLTQYTLLYGV